MRSILARRTAASEPAILCGVPQPDQPQPNHQADDEPPAQQAASPRDVFITVYGRKPVLEALSDPALTIDKVIVAEQARGDTLREILDAAAGRQIPVKRVSAHRVKVLAGNGRHDQGMLADVVAPGCVHWTAH